jgi:cellulose synthase/poly-beta-1,6-N-acetylglucosamine synthase-like glycosyltransferase
MRIIFWFSFLFIVYTYIGYPLIILIWSKIAAKQVNKKYIEPKVSIVIASYNEENFIGRKIENCLLLDYPKEKLEIIVVSDGSNDQTNKIVKGFECEGIRFFSYEGRKGKAYALNMGISRCENEIIFFTDARQILRSDSLKELVANFNDPKVGAVSGELILLDPAGKIEKKGIGLYWKFEKWMRKRESQIHSVLGATGSIYACRKNIVERIPSETILDDMLIPFRGILKGYRSIFESKAVAYDKVTRDIRREFKRKVRTLSGNYQLLMIEPNLMNPFENPVLFQLVSHKLARLFVPFAMIILFFSNLFLGGFMYKSILVLQISFYFFALFSKWGPKNKLGDVMRSLNTIFMMNLAALMGFFEFILRPKNIRWEKTT